MKKIEQLKHWSYGQDLDLLHSKINEIIDHLNQANGETPEVDNTVGQKNVKQHIQYILRNHCKESWPKDSIGEEKLLNYILYIFNTFKPVTTDKEKPVLQQHEDIANHDCYCGTIKKDQIYNKLNCDLGCMYPGA